MNHRHSTLYLFDKDILFINKNNVNVIDIPNLLLFGISYAKALNPSFIFKISLTKITFLVYLKLSKSDR